LDQETVHYLSDFLGALQMLQAEKSGRNLENMIDKEASNDRRLDRILSIGDFSENRFKFKASDEPIRHAVTFLRRQIGFIAYHDHREVFDVVSRFRESREKKELEQAEQADQETAQEIRDNLKK
ncbi:MAG: hypothetical protein QF809_04190, partial [Candidatus Peribacteraceae bacterium]|nr:hypothetical protein [Candidatus Peribacteraceae bacterium]